jgi:integrase
MAKVPMASQSSEQMVLMEIRTHQGCQSIFAVEIEYAPECKADINWHIVSIGYGGVRLEHVSRALERAHKKLRQQYNLPTDPDHAVPYGFRSTFRDWASECTNYPRDVAEMALAHAIGERVEAAYRRGAICLRSGSA